MKIILAEEDDLQQLDEALEQLPDTIVQLNRLAEVLKRLRSQTTDAEDLLKQLFKSFREIGDHVGEVGVEARIRRGKYQVRRGGLTYADVAWKEMGDEFSLDAAWSRLEPMIETEGEPRRSSLNRSLKNDDRFQRVDRDDEIWFRKRPADQLDIDGDQEEGE